MKKDLKSNLTIENAAETVKALSKYIKSADKPVIDLSVVEKIDLAGIQLLLSAQKFGEEQSKEVFFSGDLVKGVSDRLYDSGFNTFHHEKSDRLYRIRRNTSEF